MLYKNFFETFKEANMRLQGTMILYEGRPHFVFTICDHMDDGIFRIYLYPSGEQTTLPDLGDVQYNYDQPLAPQQAGNKAVGQYIDKWLENNPSTKLIRKMMNSPKLNKFRPYPLGMCDYGTNTYYVARQPNRKSEQGLTRTMLVDTPISLSNTKEPSMGGAKYVSMASPDFVTCVTGEHPTAAECLSKLLDPNIVNESHAFHREFAFIRGPIGMIFVAYKTDVVGLLPFNTLSVIKIGKKFKHLKEVVGDLNVFSSINIEQ